MKRKNENSRKMCPDARGLNDSMYCVLLDMVRYLKHGYRTYNTIVEKLNDLI